MARVKERFDYHCHNLEQVGCFGLLYEYVSRAVLIPELRPEQRWHRLDLVSAWYDLVLSDGWQPIGQQLALHQDYELVKINPRERQFELRHIGSGLVVLARSLPEAEQAMTKNVNHFATDLQQRIKEDPRRLLAEVSERIVAALNE